MGVSVNDRGNGTAEPGEARRERGRIAYIDIEMEKVRVAGQLPQLPAGRSFRSEKGSPQVVVYPHHIEAAVQQKPGRLRPDQPSGASDNSNAHASRLQRETVTLAQLIWQAAPALQRRARQETGRWCR
jgi:hypothetical protein